MAFSTIAGCPRRSPRVCCASSPCASGSTGRSRYASRPWLRAEGRTSDGVSIRFTAKPDALYALLFGTPASAEFFIEGNDLPEPRAVTHLESGYACPFEQRSEGLVVRLQIPLESA